MTDPRIGIVGAGLMGSGIAEVCARAGLDVVAAESGADAAEAARSRIGRSLDRPVRHGKLSADDRAAAGRRITVTTGFEDLADRDLVVEAVEEDEATKVEVFARLGEIVTSPDALLASNTSSIPIMKLAMATSRPEHLVGLHFINPC